MPWPSPTAASTTTISRSDPAVRRLLAVLAVCALPAVSGAQDPQRAEPADPPDGAVTGSRPVFQIEYSGIEDSALREARFRIEISTDDFRGTEYVFDQRERASGWVPGEPGRMVYRPRLPLADGSYEWRAARWNGLRWVSGLKTSEFRVDTVPPEDVDGLTLSRGPDGGVELRWRAVTADREGGTEHVARYHVYRYAAGPPFRVARHHEIGSTQDLELLDNLAGTVEARLIFYRVTAEDLAGNEPLRRD